MKHTFRGGWRESGGTTTAASASLPPPEAINGADEDAVRVGDKAACSASDGWLQPKTRRTSETRRRFLIILIAGRW
jgi:hypothetical protein